MPIMPARMRSLAPRTPLGRARVLARPVATVPINLRRESMEEILVYSVYQRRGSTGFSLCSVTTQLLRQQQFQILTPQVPNQAIVRTDNRFRQIALRLLQLKDFLLDSV